MTILKERTLLRKFGNVFLAENVVWNTQADSEYNEPTNALL
jgi:hypothetical protein